MMPDEETTATIVQKNIDAMYRALASTSYMKFFNNDGLMRISSPTIDYSEFNHILYCCVKPKYVPNIIEKMTTLYRPNAKSLLWTVPPLRESPALESHLLQAGGVLSGFYKYAMKQLLDEDALLPEPPQSAEIQQVMDREKIADWVEPQSDAHGLSESTKQLLIKHYQELFKLNNGFKFYTVYKGNVPVTSALLHLNNQVGHMCSLCTCHFARKNGYALYLQKYRISQAKLLGCKFVIGQGNSMSIPLFKKNGFLFYGTCKDYLFSFKGE
jgi:hypothetical protein